MDTMKQAFTNRWVWLALALILAFLAYLAPRVAYSIPFI